MPIVTTTDSPTGVEPMRCGRREYIALQERYGRPTTSPPHVRGFEQIDAEAALREYGIRLFRRSDTKGNAQDAPHVDRDPGEWVALPLQCHGGVLGIPTNEIVLKLADGATLRPDEVLARVKPSAGKARLVPDRSAVSSRRYVIRIEDGSARDALAVASDLKGLIPGVLTFVEVNYVRSRDQSTLLPPAQ